MFIAITSIDSTIDSTSISFDFIQVDAAGKRLATSSHTLKTGFTADLNEDGIDDISYTKSEEKNTML